MPNLAQSDCYLHNCGEKRRFTHTLANRPFVCSALPDRVRLQSPRPLEPTRTRLCVFLLAALRQHFGPVVPVVLFAEVADPSRVLAAVDTARFPPFAWFERHQVADDFVGEEAVRPT